MADANEKDNALKSESSLEKGVIEKDEAPLNLSDDMEEEEDDGDEVEYDDDDDDEDEDDEEGEEEEEEYEEYDDNDDEPKEEKVNDGGNGVVVVKNEGHEKSKENAVKEDGKKGEEPKSDKKLDESSKSKEKKPRGRNTKKNEKNDSGTLAANGDKPESSTRKKAADGAKSEPSNRKKSADGDKPESSNKKKAANGDKPGSSNKMKAANGDKPESSNKKKAAKRVECMGMVFMCSSKTKADCFRYKILGLPESKKDQVLKIYKGMRLFLFDVDLRLMYGIFKAAGPGGYNIEPEAFKSDFPSQVRFTVLEDCLPLAEENFKSVLKENYYSRNKFEGLLKSEQVKKLCKMFVDMGGVGRRSRSAVKSRRTRRSRRSRPDESHRSRLDDRRTSRAQEKRKRPRDEERCPRSPPSREKRRYPDYDRSPVLYDRKPPVVYDREPLVSRYPHLPEPTAVHSPVRLYTYERQPLDVQSYVRDHVPEPPTYRVFDRDPYLTYSRDQPPLYRDPVYTVPPEYHIVSREYPNPSAVRTPEYHLSGGSRVPNYRDVEIASDYRPAAALPDYRPRTHYRY